MQSERFFIWNKYISYLKQIYFLFETNIFLIWNKYISSLKQIYFLFETNTFLIRNKYTACVGLSTPAESDDGVVLQKVWW